MFEATFPPHREVIDLVYYHGKSVGEVAEIVGIPASTVKTRMHYARGRMATLLEQAGIDDERAYLAIRVIGCPEMESVTIGIQTC